MSKFGLRLCAVALALAAFAVNTTPKDGFWPSAMADDDRDDDRDDDHGPCHVEDDRDDDHGPGHVETPDNDDHGPGHVEDDRDDDHGPGHVETQGAASGGRDRWRPWLNQ